MGITEVARRDIIDLILGQTHPFHGRLSVLPFLERIWDLSAMPSSDGRFTSARQDIAQHYINWSDWTTEQLLCDHLDLLTCDDETFLRFTEQVIHPEVMSDDALRTKLVNAINLVLKPDDYMLVQAGTLGIHPVFEHMQPSDPFSIPVDLSELARLTALNTSEAKQESDDMHVAASSNNVTDEARPIPLFPAGPFTRNERLCFVLMPFKDELREVFDVGIKPAVEGAGMECLRADDIMESGSVLAQIYQRLRSARVVIADVTGANGNVLYELGLAHMMGHQVILLTQSMPDVPFDLRQQRHIEYQHSVKGVNTMRDQLSRFLDAALRENR